MPLIAIILASLGQFPETEYSEGSRTLFPEIADLEIDDGRLSVSLKGATYDASALRTRALALFPSASRVRVQTNRGSTSTSRGGGSGQVYIRAGAGGTSLFTYRLTSGDGRERIVLEQSQDGKLKLEIESRGSHVSLEQAGNKCSLKIRVGEDRVSAKGPSLVAILQDHPLEARGHLFSAIAHYFGDPPFKPLMTAPPGKTAVRLQDGAVIFGEIDLESIILETDYGRLTIPRSELFHVFFPGSGSIPGMESAAAAAAGADAPRPRGETLVITPRFTPRGRIDLDVLRLHTPYGELEIAASDIRHIAFGPVDNGHGEETEERGSPAAGR